MEPVRRILIINGKGGCGKTTIATNLAVAYANRGNQVVIMDHDSQASATEWAEQRPTSLPHVHLVRAHQRAAMYETQSFKLRIPDDASHIIIDAASLSAERNIDALIRQSDIIVVPMLPSSIDIRAGSKFIAELLTHRSYRRRPLPVAVVANRTRQKTVAYEKLFNFLQCLDCLLYTSPSPRDREKSRMPSSA